MSDIFGIPPVTVPIQAGVNTFVRDIVVVQNQLKQTKSFAKSITDEMHSLGKSVRSVGLGVTAGISAPITLLGKKTVDSFAEFDQALHTSLSIAGNVSEALKKEVASTAKTLSTEITTTATDLVGSFYELISSGYSLQRGLKAIGPIAKFAHAGLFNLGEATTILVDAQKAIGLGVADTVQNMDNLIRVSDVLIKANQIANGTVRQFSRALTNQAAPAARMYGIELEDAVSALAVMADQGLKGVIAGIRLSMVLRGLASAAIKHDESFRKLGVRFFDVTGKIRPLYTVVKDLETALQGMSDKEKQLTLMTMGFSERTLGGLMPLIGQSDKMFTFYNKLSKESTGLTEDVVSRQLDAYKAKMQLIKNDLNVVKIDIGEKIAPYILKIAEGVRDIVVWFGNLHEKTIRFVITLGAGLAIIGPILVIVGGMVMAFSSVIKKVIQFGTLIKNISMFLFRFGIAFHKIVSAIFIGIQTGLVFVIKSIPTMTKAIVSALTMTLSFIKKILASIAFIVDAVILLGWAMYNDAKRFLFALVLIKTKIKEIAMHWISMFSLKRVKVFFSTVLSGLKAMATMALTQVLPSVLSGFYLVTVIISIAKMIKNKVGKMGPEVFLGWVDAAQGFFINFRENFVLLFEWIQENWKDILQNILIGIANILPKLASLFIDFASIIKDAMSTGLMGYEKMAQRAQFENRIYTETIQLLAIEEPGLSRKERKAKALRITQKEMEEYDQEHDKELQKSIYDRLTKAVEKIRAWDELPLGIDYKKLTPMPEFNLTLPGSLEEPYIDEDDFLKDIGDILPDLTDSITGLSNVVSQKLASWAEAGSQDFYRSLYSAADKGQELQSGILSATQKTADGIEDLLDLFSRNQANMEQIADNTSVADTADKVEESISTSTSTDLLKEGNNTTGVWKGEVAEIVSEKNKETEKAAKQIEKNTRDQIPIQENQARTLSSILETLVRNSNTEVSLP